MKEKWHLARYLIDAKKNIDSVWYIADNAKQLRYIDLRKRINGLRSEFYIKCCVVVDEYISCQKIKKKDLCQKDDIVDRIYYERDKNSAHKDDQYREQDYTSLEDIKTEMILQITHIRDFAAICLPEVLTLDFISYDRELFRFIHHITADVEDEILKRKYPLRDMPMGTECGKTLNVLNDTEDLRTISSEERSNYCVVIHNGICFNEGIQERQDACIKMNTLFNQNVWCSINKKDMEKLEELVSLGCFDEYGIVQEPPKDPILLARIQKILDSPIEA